jgi:hypothetical protein
VNYIKVQLLHLTNNVWYTNHKNVTMSHVIRNAKCAALGADGPTLNTDTNRETKQFDYYYFQRKCYGTGCPKVV